MGRLACVDFIPSRPGIALALPASADFRFQTWSRPFWSITIQTDAGEYLHAALDPHTPPPPLGDPVSLVARAAGPFRSRRVVLCILRPDLRLAVR